MDTARKAPVMRFHPKKPGAGPEQLRCLAGVVALRGPVPSGKFMDSALPDRLAERARD
jgi:hypothetical protein